MNTKLRLRGFAHILDSDFLGSLRGNTMIGLELPSRDFIDKHLINLFEASIFSLRNEEEEEDLSPSAVFISEAA